MKLMDRVDEYVSYASNRELAFMGVCLTALGVLFGASVCQKCKTFVRVLAGIVFVGGVIAAVMKYLDCSLKLCCDDDCDCCDDDCCCEDCDCDCAEDEEPSKEPIEFVEVNIDDIDLSDFDEDKLLDEEIED